MLAEEAEERERGVLAWELRQSAQDPPLFDSTFDPFCLPFFLIFLLSDTS